VVTLKRNIAFFIAKANDLEAISKSKEHMINLAQENGYLFNQYEKFEKVIFLVSEGESILDESDFSLNFSIGNFSKERLEIDRFLKVSVKNESVNIINDYAGSIPVYYSLRNNVIISNVEPCVVIASQTKAEDISYENVYGYMKFLHYIWDETAYKHIFTLLPDSKTEFDFNFNTVKEIYLETVKASDEFSQFDDKEVAGLLYDLNKKLVKNSFYEYEKIILPLSSGYDSRMILAAISSLPEIKSKLHCYTYGSEGSIEVESARRLAAKVDVDWEFIDLPLEFLDRVYLDRIDQIFGTSLHMHGMYQMEFFEEIKRRVNLNAKICLTSGFMTGVPAGQHNSLLNINDSTVLTDVMSVFYQSDYNSDVTLDSLTPFKGKGYIKTAELRFKKAFDRFNGRVDQKAVMFDIWTRQRNFIGYYPRTFEWLIDTVSPHMNKDYINFFMKLSKKHLCDRNSVELMFKYHYPELSKIASNSNGVRSISSGYENTLFFLSRVLNKFHLGFIMPQRYKNKVFNFDLHAIKKFNEAGFYPLFCNIEAVDIEINKILDRKQLKKLYQLAYSGDNPAFSKLISLQSLAFSYLKRVK
jgi:hypothetical protein